MSTSKLQNGSLLLACLAVLTPCAAPAAPATPWQLAPYRIQLLVAVDPAAPLAPQFEADLAAGLAARSDSLLGGPWDLKATAAPAELRDRMLGALDAVTADALPKSADADKIMLLAISAGPAGFKVAARELDVRTGALGGVVRLEVAQAVKLRDAAMRALVRAFAPLALVHGVDQDKVRLRVKASALAPRDKEVKLVGAGSSLRPVVRYNDAAGNLARVQPLPWTTLVVTEAGAEEAAAKLTTGLKTSLFAANGRAAEPLALGVVATTEPVTLVLQSPRDEKIGRPLYDVLGANSRMAHPERSNAQGEVVLPGAAGQLVEVRSGQDTFARVPLVAAGQSRIVLPVAADARLLEAESYLVAAQDELADLAALRQILIARINKALEARALDDAKGALAELQGLKTLPQFTESLTAAQKRVIAEENGVQQRIDALFSQTAKLAQAQLDPKPVEELAARVKAGK